MEPLTAQPTEFVGNVRFVSLFLTTTSSQVRKDFHCIKCGRICFNYYDDVRLLYEGEVSIQEYVRNPTQPHDIMCSRCKMMYRVE